MAITEMPEDVKAIFDPLYDDVVALSYRYKLFKQMYGTQDAVNLMNASAPYLFAEMREIWMESLLLLIAQMTDPPKMGKFENLSISKLVEVVDAYEAGLSGKMGLDIILTELEGHTRAIREVRNRTLAHNDLTRRNETMPPVMKREIDGSIVAFEKALNITSIHFRNMEVRCEMFTVADGDALIQVLTEWREFSKGNEPWRWNHGD